MLKKAWKTQNSSALSFTTSRRKKILESRKPKEAKLRMRLRRQD